MGRHATPPALPDPPDAPAGRAARLASRYLPRLVLAVCAAITTTLAVAWAGNAWSSATVAGGAVAVVVLGAAWLAGTVPSPPSESAPDTGHDAVQ
ncbi:hypothetical protein [Actinotalea fermentans]|nr:hypothetical protein [Actinotalea fermentans]